MFRQLVALGLCTTLIFTGCASASGGRVPQPVPSAAHDRDVLADYAQRLPAGSKVRVERASGHSLRGTLMKASADAIVVQKNTRVPEPPVDIPLADVTRLTIDPGTSVGKHIAIGVASGVAATFGVFLVLAAIWSD